jgi:hypothetical protein
MRTVARSGVERCIADEAYTERSAPSYSKYGFKAMRVNSLADPLVLTILRPKSQETSCNLLFSSPMLDLLLSTLVGSAGGGDDDDYGDGDDGFVLDDEGFEDEGGQEEEDDEDDNGLSKLGDE